MKTILVYDTETSGLPEWSLPSNDPSQPHIIELAAQLCIEDTGEVVGSMNVLIRPDGWTIPQELQELTGITMEMAMTFGVPIAFALELFMQLWRNVDMRVAHNESFDMRMLRIELMRDSVFSTETEGDKTFADHWKSAPSFCTQGKSVSILNLPPTPKMVAAKRKGPKSPNLGEAYQFFTGKPLEGAHRAMVDVDACKAVYYGIRAQDLAPASAA